jgi:hypothetical protein
MVLKIGGGGGRRMLRLSLGQVKTMRGITEAESELWDNALSATTAMKAFAA